MKASYPEVKGFTKEMLKEWWNVMMMRLQHQWCWTN